MLDRIMATEIIEGLMGHLEDRVDDMVELFNERGGPIQIKILATLTMDGGKVHCNEKISFGIKRVEEVEK